MCVPLSALGRLLVHVYAPVSECTMLQTVLIASRHLYKFSEPGSLNTNYQYGDTAGPSMAHEEYKHKRDKEQGTRNKEQGARSKEQGARNKEQIY